MTMTQDSVHRQPGEADARERRHRTVAVGDVLVRRDDGGYGIFNYRGERVFDVLLASAAEAARLAADIVSPWRGRVQVEDPGSRA